MPQRVTNLRHGGENRIGRLDEGVEAAELAEVGGRRLAVERRRVLAALAPWRGENYGRIDVAGANGVPLPSVHPSP